MRRAADGDGPDAELAGPGFDQVLDLDVLEAVGLAGVVDPAGGHGEQLRPVGGERGVAHAIRLLRQEIEKASLLAGPGEPVTRKHVELAVSAVAEEPIWDLTDAIGQGRVSEAVDLLSRLLAQGAAPPAILGALVTALTMARHERVVVTQGDLEIDRINRALADEKVDVVLPPSGTFCPGGYRRSCLRPLERALRQDRLLMPKTDGRPDKRTRRKLRERRGR